MDIQFNQFEDQMKLLISHFNKELEKIKLGGGQKKLDHQKKIK